MKSLLFLLCLTVQLHAQIHWESESLTATPGDADGSCQFTFKGKNTGKSAITIAALTPLCKCLTLKSSVQKLEPGAAVELAVVMELGLMQGEERKEFIVTTTGAEELRQTLAVNVNLKKFFAVTGAVSKWQVGEASKAQTAVINIEKPYRIKILSAKPFTDDVTVQLVEKQAGKEYSVSITPKDLSKKGFGAIELITDSPFPRAKRLELFYTVVAPRNPAAK